MEHWIWLFVALACIVWYLVITAYIAWKGSADIAAMLKKLKTPK